MSLLTNAFTSAFCTTPVKPGDTVTCNCGQTHKSTEERPVKTGEAIGGETLVDVCDCAYAESFGGTMWRYRHELARFFRNMMDAQLVESQRLSAELPAELAPENWAGRSGTLAPGATPAICLEDNGDTLLIVTSGIHGGRQKVYRSVFTPLQP